MLTINGKTYNACKLWDIGHILKLEEKMQGCISQTPDGRPTNEALIALAEVMYDLDPAAKHAMLSWSQGDYDDLQVEMDYMIAESKKNRSGAVTLSPEVQAYKERKRKDAEKKQAKTLEKLLGIVAAAPETA